MVLCRYVVVGDEKEEIEDGEMNGDNCSGGYFNFGEY